MWFLKRYLGCKNDMLKDKYTGSCLCRAIQFQINGPLAPIQICHCAQCRHAQGGPFATNIPVSRSDFQLISGETSITSYESSPGKRRTFCSQCGSPIFSERESLPNVIRVRAGLLDEPVQATLKFHAFVASKSSWWPINDDLPQYDAAAPK
jgi:hypothetical protein